MMTGNAVTYSYRKEAEEVIRLGAFAKIFLHSGIEPELRNSNYKANAIFGQIRVTGIHDEIF